MGFFFFLLSFFLFFVSYSLSSLNGHIVRSKCNLKMHVRNVGYPFPLQIEGSETNHLSGPTLQFKGNFNGLCLRNETRYRQLVDNYKGSSTSCQNVMNFGPQTASNCTAILPTLRKFCFLLHYCQASQMDISKRNSTKPCQTVDGKSR